MTLQFYARPHALICTCPKNGVPAPHSTSSPHLAQTEQVRLMRFFALPDSNTSPRVTISVLGHVVVSQMGIVQVPYATVTVKYFRALTTSRPKLSSVGLCMWVPFGTCTTKIAEFRFVVGPRCDRTIGSRGSPKK